MGSALNWECVLNNKKKDVLCSVCFTALMVFGPSCRSASPEVEDERFKAKSDVHVLSQERAATVERCGRGFRGQMITPRGETLQLETAQTKACTDDDCPVLTGGLLSARHFAGNSCGEVRDNIKGNPIVDVWGAQTRVICNGYAAQAISAGYEGKIGTCDDIGITIPVNSVNFHRLGK